MLVFQELSGKGTKVTQLQLPDNRLEFIEIRSCYSPRHGLEAA
jgi:hypothetical protein